MSEMCTDNRFELIERFKQRLINGTNIKTSPDEMAVLDNILFRFWQMGWLDKLEQPTIEPERKGKWKGYNADDPNWLRTDGTPVFLICSECGQVVVNNFSAHWNYCSNCGCKMKMEEKE